MGGDRAVRQCALAVAVLDEIDLSPADEGIRVGDVLVPWAECAQALDGAHPASTPARERLARHLRARSAGRTLTIGPYAVPVGHALHPGPGWVRSRVRGGALDLGAGVAGLDPRHPRAVGPLPPYARISVDWAAALGQLTEMATYAAERVRRSPGGPLRPMGGCDVVTLLADRRFRAAVAEPTGGMRTAAVPARDRGWLDLRRIDPAFVGAAAMATDVERRGFGRPLLVTADELVLAPQLRGGSPLLQLPHARRSG